MVRTETLNTTLSLADSNRLGIHSKVNESAERSRRTVREKLDSEYDPKEKEVHRTAPHRIGAIRVKRVPTLH